MFTVREGATKILWFMFWVALSFATFDRPAIATLSPGIVTTQGGMPAGHYGLDADYMWNCRGAENCSPTQGPNQAAFEQTFIVKKNLGYPQYFYGTGALDPLDPYGGRFALSVMADDYFAVYLNNNLIGWSWLNDGSSPNAPHFSDSPMNWTMSQLLPYFVDGTNVLDIFACNGRSSDNLGQGFVPGSTAVGGFAGCPNPSSYGNNWLLVEGGFVQQDNAPGGQVNAWADFVSGNASGTDANGREAHETQFRVIPEPASIALVVTALLLGVGMRQGRKA